MYDVHHNSQASRPPNRTKKYESANERYEALTAACQTT